MTRRRAIALACVGLLSVGAAGVVHQRGVAPAHTNMVFQEGFGSGTFAAWSASTGLDIVDEPGSGARDVARSRPGGDPAAAWARLSAPASEVVASVRVNLESMSGPNPLRLLSVLSAAGKPLAEVSASPSLRLRLRDAANGESVDSSVRITLRGWHTLSLLVSTAGPNAGIEVTWDGQQVGALTGARDVGDPVGQIRIGEPDPGRVAVVAYDDVTVSLPSAAEYTAAGAAGGTAPPRPATGDLPTRTPAGWGQVFADGFEDDLARWPDHSALTVQTSRVAEGARAAQALLQGSAPAYATMTLPSAMTELTASAGVDIAAVGGTTAIGVLSLHAVDGAGLADVVVTPERRLGIRDPETQQVTVAGVYPPGFHRIQVHVTVAGAGSRYDVRLDDDPTPVLAGTAELGTSPARTVTVGEILNGRTAEIYYDAVSVAVPVGGDPVIAAVGDIACDPADRNFNHGWGTNGGCRQKAVADAILADPTVTTVAALGDVQYECGGAAAFAASYDKSWGRLKKITRPAVGNHEHIAVSTESAATDCDRTGTAKGYYSYFGRLAGDRTQGYYSYDLGAWHVVVLNSQCSQVGGCSTSSPQGLWLAADLARHRTRCTLAYYHIPLFSSGGRDSPNTHDLVEILLEHDADVVLTGHDHIYERFAPQDADAGPTRDGVRAWVVGTGGSNHTTIPGRLAANSVVSDVTSYGFLKMTLHRTSYDWVFVPVDGATFTDSGSAACR